MSTAFFYPTCTKIWRCHGKLRAERGTFTWFYFKGQDWTLYWTEVVYMNSFHDNSSRPKNKCKWRNYLMWFIFNLQRRKIHTLVHNDIQYLCVDSLACQKKCPFLRVVAILAWCEPPSTLVPCWKSTVYFPQATGPNPFPQACPLFQPHMPTHVT